MYSKATMILRCGTGAIALLSLSLFFGGCGTMATLPPGESETQVIEQATVETQHFKLNNPFPGTSVRVQQVEAIPLNLDTPPEDETPSHEALTWLNFTPPGAEEAVIRIYPTAEFEAFQFEEEKTILQALLRDRPNLESQETLPYLPLLAANQVLFAQAQYVDFPGGAGIRYLTYYSFDVRPLQGNDIFYTFQGLTEDGKYYISATFPLETKILPSPERDEAVLTEQYSSYLGEVIARLNQAAPAQDFSVDLTQLDQMFSTLEVER